ncbi:MAG: prolipoprotein diacylglyceryl transferase [Oscillospiraceae bacterium]|nr:prolipoprotein diacylglyceryl transferase [Oscillospiraceae bacterium]
MQTLEELGYGSLDYNQIVFPHLGIDVTVDPTAFTAFGVDVQWYGILIVCGMLLAMLFAFRNMRRVGIDSDRAIDAVIGGLIAALIGARAYYVILNWDEYKDDLASIFNTREGGLAVLGGLIGAIIVGGIICRIRKVKFLPMLDLCGVGFLIGQGIGRWGNFTNQEAFGKNTDCLFGMSGGRVQQWIAYNYNSVTQYDKDITVDMNYPVHPCFLYESAWCLLGALLLCITLKKWRKFDGQIILMYMVWYGLGRFFIESLRTDSLMIGSLRVSQGVAALMFVAGVILLIIGFARVKRLGSDYKLYVDTKESKQLLAEADKRIEEEAAKKAAKKAAKAAKADPDAETEKIVPDEEDDAPAEDAKQEDTEE